MKQLHKNEYENIRNLFHTNYPNLPLIFAIIEQLIPGQIWVNDKNEPKVCLVMTGASYCFMKGKVNEETFQKCFKLLQKKQIVKLAFEPIPQFDLSKYGFIPGFRRQYRYKDIHGKIPIYENKSSYLIKKIEDIEMFNLCLWKSLITDIFGSAENYLKNGIGFIFWDINNQMIASEAHGIPSKEFIEVGTITHESYRGQKLSTMLCNHLIRYAIQKDLKPVWSCDEENPISWKVAEKQGMDELIKYTFYTWTNTK
jgi:GNAT superfamily N-acetyltransferase